MQERLSFKINVEEDTAIVDLTGDIDIYTIPKLRTLVLMLEEKHVRFLIFNLQECKYIDSSGVGFIIKITKRVRLRSGEIILGGAHDGVERVLALMSIGKICPIVEDVTKAKVLIDEIKSSDLS